MKNWDKYFLGLAQAVADNSKCYSRHIGAVLVRDKFIVSTGYNGAPIGYPHCTYIESDIPISGCPRKYLGYESSKGLELCPAAHAERNAIDIAARLGHATEGCVMYLTCGVPCKDCAISIVQAGIVEVVCNTNVIYEKTGVTGLDILTGGGVKVRAYE